jgi:hypothetical protein
VTIGLAPVATAQAASAATAAPATKAGLPNSCRTFTARSADAVFRTSLRVQPTDVLQSLQAPRFGADAVPALQGLSGPLPPPPEHPREWLPGWLPALLTPLTRVRAKRRRELPQNDGPVPRRSGRRS